MRTDAVSNASPACSYSARSHPAPMPTSSRPPDRTSRVASSLASTAGWRRSWFKTKWVSRSFVVTSATACRAIRGANGIRKWSGGAEGGIPQLLSPPSDSLERRPVADTAQARGETKGARRGVAR